jgi:hypothetical protein
MRWMLTTKTQTYGLNTVVSKYECRVTRAEGEIRISFANRGPGNVREGHVLMPFDVARTLGSSLLLASTDGTDHMNVVFSIDEAKSKLREGRPGDAARQP